MVYGAGFENQLGSNPLGGSNPPPSAFLRGLRGNLKNMSIFAKKNKIKPENLKEVLVELKSLEGNFEKISKELEELRRESRFWVRKIGIVRFNPFSEVGGDQSFSIALLDANNSGVVISSLYSRQENRIYGKPIKNGKSEYQLSEEENQAIEKAKNDQKNQK